MAVFVIGIILNNIKAKVEAYKLVKSSIDKADGGVMVLDKYLPWTETVVDYNEGTPKIQLVVYPNNRAGISIQVVPMKMGSFDSWLRIPDDVANYTGCTGSAHGAYAFFDSIENATAAAKDIVKKTSAGL